VYPNQAVGWSLVGGEPLSRIASQGSTHQAPESMLMTALLNHAGDGAAEATLTVA
jgi:hypothetical protein